MFVLPFAHRVVVHPYIGRTPRHSAPAVRVPAMDVAESDAAYTLSFDLPGIGRDDVKVTLDEARLSIEAAHAAAPHAAEAAQIIYRERNRPRFERHLKLPDDADPGRVDARFENAVLTLTVPKRAKPAPVRIEVA